MEPLCSSEISLSSEWFSLSLEPRLFSENLVAIALCLDRGGTRFV
jgi:hypothetical protein